MTPNLLCKPVVELNAVDVDELITRKWPEGFDVEYKMTLPGKDGADDPWLLAKDHIGRYARDEILAEVVAFANAQGGTVVVGIDQSEDPPPKANRLVPLPRIAQLAERFEDAARSTIDPPLQRIYIKAVETGSEGAGVLVIRTPASLSAPHRLSTTRTCYVRRQASTVSMSMREIQDMTLNVARGVAGIDAAFEKRRDAYGKWSRSLGAIAGFHITALPLAQLPDPGRLFGKSDIWPNDAPYLATIGNSRKEIRLPIANFGARPGLRCLVKEYVSQTRLPYRWEIAQSGLIDLCFAKCEDTQSDGLNFYHSQVVAGAAHVMKMISNFRTLVGVPEADYALELQITPLKTDPLPRYIGMRNQYRDEEFDLSMNIDLPRTSVGLATEFDDVLTAINTDIFDALGARTEHPDRLHVEIN